MSAALIPGIHQQNRSDQLSAGVLLFVIATLPFEVRSLPLVSSLQWSFILLVVVSLPVLSRDWKSLLGDRLVIAGGIFAATQWLSAALAPEFRTNAILGAIRVSVGLVLFCITLCSGNRHDMMRAWAVSAILAAALAILEYSLHLHRTFHIEEYYVGPIRRLSGSFEYPNTAATFFAMSLPIVWATLQDRWIRIAGAMLLLTALVLTYSRGGEIALLSMVLIWALIGRSRSALLVTALCLAVLAGFLVYQPFILQRFAGKSPVQPFASRIEPQYNKLRLAPDANNDVVLKITNVGTSTWEESPDQPFTLLYRWYDPLAKRLVQKSTDYVPIPRSLQPQETIILRLPFRVPHESGLHLMTWDVSQGDKNKFRDHGVFPGLVEVDIQPDASPSFGNGDLSRWLRRDVSRLLVANVPLSRRELWESALDMVRKHPVFGIGPDNFRLLYGRYFGMYQWNTKVRANSLYLELLAGSGIAGLSAFVIMIAAVRRNATVPLLAIGIFLVHGVVDIFLMTTPIYFAFWILLALAHRGADQESAPGSNA